jgi:hypothetical protein
LFGYNIFKPKGKRGIVTYKNLSTHQLTAILLALSILPSSIAQEQEAVLPLTEMGGANCTFKADPDEYTALEARVRESVQERAMSFKGGRQSASSRAAAPGTIEIKGMIDEAIFGKLASAGVPSARLTTDEEFVRRIYLDLTGRIPTIEQYRAFIEEKNERKRSDLIDRLLYSREFTDKWTMWWGDLLQNAASNAYRNQQVGARNNFFGWIAQSVSQNKSIKDIVFEAITAKGNTERGGSDGPSTWINRWRTPGGPIEDTYDTLFSRSVSAFMGMGHYDCIMCHDGRGHLEQLSLWGRRATRMEAYQMAAYFSRVRFSDRNQMAAEFPNSTDISDSTTGNYNMNTTFGNRPRRVQIGMLRSANPAWRMGEAEPNGSDWRGQFATRLVNDKMFARNFANRLWKEVFNMALVEPVDQLDPARLDPKNPPTGDWTLQATHPELLEKLAEDLIENNYNLREFMRKLVESNAYQLSSDYGDGWKAEYVPLFARHYVRRLEGEEVHDAIQTATNVLGRYTIGGWAEPVNWAMQMPEPVEPNSNGGVRDFMNLFLRGNRNTQQRSQDGSILQQLNLMNNGFVTSRAKVAASTSLRSIALMTDRGSMADELFLRFLGRMPSETEKAKTMAHLAKAGTVQAAKNSAVEDLAWVMMNKQEFIFSY